MLTDLTIRDFAIIDELALEFRDGFSTLTGETGAGKSILLDALQLALGERADSGQVREGAAKAEVVARFELASDPELSGWLGEHELGDEGELLLRRVVGSDGRSRGWVNGTPVPIQTLKELGRRLVEIHGQNEHQFLRSKNRQLDIVDRFSGMDELLEQLAARYQTWADLKERLEQLRSAAALAPAERELLRFQIEELEQVAVSPEEIGKLESEHRLLAHAGDILSAVAAAQDLLDDADDGACGRIARARDRVAAQSSADDALVEARDLLESALIQAEEASVVLARFGDGLELDPERLEAVDGQLSALHQLARKHRVDVTDLSARLEELQSRLASAEDSDAEERRLLKALEAAERDYRELSSEVSKRRTRAAQALSGAVSKGMSELGMDGGSLSIEVKHDTDRPFSLRGQDDLAFMVATNPGARAGPLSRIASGGELSRICLAIKVAATEADAPATMIFDEVDAGVGGAVAQIVGEKLRGLARNRQVFCVTHLPQVASCAQHHFRVEKRSADGTGTTTSVRPLNAEQRIEEVARMLGGVEITTRATDHAREMIEAAKGLNQPG